MKFFQFLQEESTMDSKKTIWYSIVAGFSNFLLLLIINQAASKANYREIHFYPFSLFFLFLIMHLYAKRVSQKETTYYVENIIHKIQVRLTRKIREAELINFEKIDKAQVFTTLTRDTILVSQATRILTSSIGSLIMIFTSLLYIASLSFHIFVVSTFFIATGALMYCFIGKKMEGALFQNFQKENEFFTYFDHLVKGFKELKLNRPKCQNIFSKFLSPSADDLFNQKSLIHKKFSALGLTAMFVIYSLLGTIVFIFPFLEEIQTSQIIQIITTILFFLGPLHEVVGAIPQVFNANASVMSIRNLENLLDKSLEDSTLPFPLPSTGETPTKFKNLLIRKLKFTYPSPQENNPFICGPIDFAIKKGEITFIVGGNGSGKSTLLKLLTGLYLADQGEIYLDETKIDQMNLSSYRNLFSIIFADFHLFDQLYGIDQIDQDEIEKLLKTFQLDHKTKITERKIHNVQLSSGQKKRLALIVSFLENKPIAIFDEWAADQDPEFRHFFYESLLPQLKQRGQTIIAVTHDEKYFYKADHLFKMEGGKIFPMALPIKGISPLLSGPVAQNGD